MATQRDIQFGKTAVALGFIQEGDLEAWLTLQKDWSSHDQSLCLQEWLVANHYLQIHQIKIIESHRRTFCTNGTPTADVHLDTAPGAGNDNRRNRFIAPMKKFYFATANLLASSKHNLIWNKKLNMAKKFSNKVVFITGASAGIGEALALAFSQEGAKLALVARRQQRLLQVQQKIVDSGGEAIISVSDVCDQESINQAVAQVIDKWGQLDIAVANAGFAVRGTIADLSIADFQRQMETNFFGLLHTIYASLPFLKNSKGQLVLMGSIAGRFGVPNASAYSASKFAVNGLAESLGYELAGHGITVSCINPGIVASDIDRVDNQGIFDESRQDRRPAALIVPTHNAARKMLHGIYRGKPEIVITNHGKLMCWLNRLSPTLLRWILRRANSRRGR